MEKDENVAVHTYQGVTAIATTDRALDRPITRLIDRERQRQLVTDIYSDDEDDGPEPGKRDRRAQKMRNEDNRIYRIRPSISTGSCTAEKSTASRPRWIGGNCCGRGVVLMPMLPIPSPPSGPEVVVVGFAGHVPIRGGAAPAPTPGRLAEMVCTFPVPLVPVFGCPCPFPLT